MGAKIKQEESFDAQKKLYKGAVPLNCAVVFLVYRENAESLDLACDLLCNSFGTAKVMRERNIANLIWLETLPITENFANALSVIVMGRLDAPHLAQRVDAILMQALDVFLSDPDIIERYNLAFSLMLEITRMAGYPNIKGFWSFLFHCPIEYSKARSH